MAVTISVSAKENSYSVANNTSNVTVTATINWTYGSYNHYGTCTGSITIDGTSYSFSGMTINPNNTQSGSASLMTKTVDIAHNADGSKSINYSTTFNTGLNSTGTISASGSLVLTKIPRQATITGGDNFNDEGNPTITYSNPAGNAIDELVAGIYDTNGKNPYVEYRAISKTGSSYTFNLTTAERNALRNAIPKASSLNVKFYIRTTIGSVKYYSSIQRTMTIVNGNPTISPTVVDSNETTIALTGDKNNLIRYYSNAQVTLGMAAIKGASLTSQKCSNSGKELTANGAIKGVTSGSFSFSATDSRGKTTTKTLNKSMIEYIKLTCNCEPKISVDGIATINPTGNYFSGSFGKVTNTITAQVRYKPDGGTFSDWIDISSSGSAGNWNGIEEIEIADFDYKKTYVFEVKANDKLMSLAAKTYKVSALPVFDWSKEDFNFNVAPSYKEIKLIYETGDSIQFMGEMPFSATITSSSSNIYAFIPLNKPVLANGVRFEGQVVFRGVKGYLYATNYDAACKDINEILSKVWLQDNGIFLRFSSDSAVTNSTNNTPVMMSIAKELTITFT